MKAFMTGSRVYGKPRDDSDVDLVVRMDSDTAISLYKLCGSKDCIRFGILNILPAVSDKEYQIWKEGTEKLIRKMEKTGKPITREEAVTLFKSMREKSNVFPQWLSGETDDSEELE